MANIPGISNFHRTVAIHRASCDVADTCQRRFGYHYVESADSHIKVERGSTYQDSPKIRGAIAWAIRQPGRQVTILKDGRVLIG